MSMPAVGDQAPEVALEDQSGAVHRLSDQAGRWTILYFYPKDDTPGCTVEACEFRDANDTIVERGADVWGVSPQGGAEQARVHREVRPPVHPPRRRRPSRRRGYGSWVEKENYGKKYWGTARTTFLVGPDGRIAGSGRRSSRKATPREVLAALDEEQAVRVG